MISFIKGTVAYKEKDALIVENQGMGYRVFVPQHLLGETDSGEQVTLHTHFYLREDAMSLYGFTDRRELSVFRLLLGVSGIGPKVAVSVLSTLTVEDLVYAVFNEDVKAISRTPGIGPKGAKRLIIELKDKLDMEEYIDQTLSGIPSGTLETDAVSGQEISDAILALEALGYPKSTAKQAVLSIPDVETMDSGQILKEALKYIR